MDAIPMESVPLVTFVELVARTPFEMDAADQREAEGALETLSDDARFYGSDGWENPASTPQMVKNLIIKAAVRHMKNYEGFTQSRAGDETVMWTDRGHEAGSAYFTKREQKQLATIANRTGIYSAPVQAWGTKLQPEGYVPTDSGDKPFPFFSSDTSPW